MAKSKWSELKKEMGESLVKATGGRTRKRLWRVEETPSELRTSSIVERALQEFGPVCVCRTAGHQVDGRTGGGADRCHRGEGLTENPGVLPPLRFDAASAP